MTKSRLIGWLGGLRIASYLYFAYALSKHVSTVDAIAIVLAFSTLVGALQTKIGIADLTEPDASPSRSIANGLPRLHVRRRRGSPRSSDK